MASPRSRLPTNVDGDLYVDSTCIDCDTCRWMAPDTFDRSHGQSRVFAQPKSGIDARRAEMALLACPTSSIRTTTRRDLSAAEDLFPDPIEGDVYHCGYHSEKSFGAASYLIVRPTGNVLIDSPRFAAPLVRKLEALGGVKTMFLTHRDDVADHEKFHQRFGCDRILHSRDVTAGTRGVEHQVEGDDDVVLDDELRILSTPGHTAGSTCLLYREDFLFTGDHLAYSRARRSIQAFKNACWYDWPTLVKSVRKLLDYRFRSILPGHGHRISMEADQMAASIARYLEEIGDP